MEKKRTIRTKKRDENKIKQEMRREKKEKAERDEMWQELKGKDKKAKWELI